MPALNPATTKFTALAAALTSGTHKYQCQCGRSALALDKAYCLAAADPALNVAQILIECPTCGQNVVAL